MPRIAVLFLTRDGTSFKETWERWYTDWDDYYKSTFGNTAESADDFLKGALFRNQDATIKTTLERSPSFTRDNVVPNPVEAGRFNLLRAERQLFSYGLKEFPSATHFILLSDTTIPVKPFRHIWGSLAADPRSKLDLFCLEHREGYPKHSQWIVLTRNHAKALVADHPIWEHGHDRAIRGTCPTLFGANDEYWPARIVCENANITTYDQFRSEFETRSLSHPLGTLNWRTFVDWNMYNPDYSNKTLGEPLGRRSRSSHPITYQTITARFLRTLVATENVWFARKMTGDRMPVLDCNESPLIQIGDALNGELRTVKRPTQAVSKVPYDFGPLFKCALVDFLDVLLRRGPWVPVVGSHVAAYLDGYVKTEEDELNLGHGGLYVVRDANQRKVEGGLDSILAGSLKGSNWTNGTGLTSGITVELRPFNVVEIAALDERSLPPPNPRELRDRAYDPADVMEISQVEAFAEDAL